MAGMPLTTDAWETVRGLARTLAWGRVEGLDVVLHANVVHRCFTGVITFAGTDIWSADALHDTTRQT